jgi:hypothetical protein
VNYANYLWKATEKVAPAPKLGDNASC